MHQLAAVLTSLGENRRENGSYGRLGSPEISEKRKAHQHKTKLGLIWLDTSHACSHAKIRRSRLHLSASPETSMPLYW